MTSIRKAQKRLDRWQRWTGRYDRHYPGLRSTPGHEKAYNAWVRAMRRHNSTTKTH